MTQANERSEQPELHRRRRPVRRAAALAILMLIVSACSGEGPQSALEPQGPIATDIDGLWDLVLVLATGVLIVVMAAFVISIWRFRERKGDDREPKQIHGNTKVEIAWTILPAILLAVITVPTVKGLFDIREVPQGDDVLQISVTGHQWWWEFEYTDYVGDDGRPLVTANELHIPAGMTVNLTMTSADVIHSFWIPPLNGKRDVVPGRVTNLTLEADLDVVNQDTGFGEGVILGQCAEFCGLAHADMRIRAFVHTQNDFAAWAAGQLEPAIVPSDGLAADGYETFTQVCTACHQATVQLPDGTVETIGVERHIESGGVEFRSSLGPNLTHFGSRDTFGSATFDNATEHLSAWLANPSSLKPMDPDRNVISEGRILGMPNFGLSDDEIKSLVALLQEWQ